MIKGKLSDEKMNYLDNWLLVESVMIALKASASKEKYANVQIAIFNNCIFTSFRTTIINCVITIKQSIFKHDDIAEGFELIVQIVQLWVKQNV